MVTIQDYLCMHANALTNISELGARHDSRIRLFISNDRKPETYIPVKGVEVEFLLDLFIV